jgi:hypothetical protein
VKEKTKSLCSDQNFRVFVQALIEIKGIKGIK